MRKPSTPFIIHFITNGRQRENVHKDTFYFLHSGVKQKRKNKQKCKKKVAQQVKIAYNYSYQI